MQELPLRIYKSNSQYLGAISNPVRIPKWRDWPYQEIRAISGGTKVFEPSGQVVPDKGRNSPQRPIIRNYVK